jgi:DNA-binding XRE family transcriptional regulator
MSTTRYPVYLVNIWGMICTFFDGSLVQGKTSVGRGRPGAEDGMTKRREGRAGALYSAVGAELKARRMVCGVNQDFLALEVGLSRASIANIEGGRQAVPLHHLAKIAEALGTTGSAILRAVESKPKANEHMPADLPNPVAAFVRDKVRLAP